MKRYVKKSGDGTIRTITRIYYCGDGYHVIRIDDSNKSVRDAVLVEESLFEELKLSVGDDVIIGTNSIAKVSKNHKPEEFMGFEITNCQQVNGTSIALYTNKHGPVFMVYGNGHDYKGNHYLIDGDGSCTIIRDVDLENQYEEVKS